MHTHKRDHATHTVLEPGEEIWTCEMSFRALRSHWVQERIGGEEIKIMMIGIFVEEFMRK